MPPEAPAREALLHRAVFSGPCPQTRSHRPRGSAPSTVHVRSDEAFKPPMPFAVADRTKRPSTWQRGANDPGIRANIAYRLVCLSRTAAMLFRRNI
jgi:hypothetical protein